MNGRVKKKWLKALRSGCYQQGRGQLVEEGNRRDKFCCLGVLCNLHAEETKGTWEFGDDESNANGAYFGEDAHLPQEVVEWAGLDCDNPMIHGTRISDFNDGDVFISTDHIEPHSFKQIADLIEEYL